MPEVQIVWQFSGQLYKSEFQKLPLRGNTNLLTAFEDISWPTMDFLYFAVSLCFFLLLTFPIQSSLICFMFAKCRSSYFRKCWERHFGTCVVLALVGVSQRLSTPDDPSWGVTIRTPLFPQPLTSFFVWFVSSYVSSLDTVYPTAMLRTHLGG